MNQEIISSIIFTIFDQTYGPKSIAHIPSDLDFQIHDLVSNKTINSLFEETSYSKNASLMDFPSISLKGLSKAFTWNDVSLRGGMGMGTITILFNERYDVVFYKYREDFDIVFNEMIGKYKDMVFKNISSDWLRQELNQYLDKFQKLLDTLASSELKKVDEASAFPDASKSAPESDYLFKIVVLGDPEVGKTSTVLRYTENAFKRSYIPTIGVNISSKNVIHNNKSIQLLLWDLAGQAKFSYIRQQFYQGSQAALLVFSLIDRKSFESISRWYDDLKQLKDFAKLKIILCGNKSDLTNMFQVKKEEAEEMANKYGIPYFEVSALTGKNNRELFENIINSLLQN